MEEISRMLKNLLYLVFASFIFFMGYISEDFIALYETRPNQYPPYGKEVVDVNGTKFMRDIKDETNENEQKPSEDFIALEKKYPSGCDSTSTLSKDCLLYTSPSPRDVEESRMPSSA